MRLASKLLPACMGAAFVTGLGVPVAHAQIGLQVEIRKPAPDRVLPNEQNVIEVRGHASDLVSIPKLDLFLVMDTSKSLRKADPSDHRSAGAIALVKFLYWSDTYMGLVDFDREARLVSPLTGDRTPVMKAIRGLDRDGRTDLAAGIRKALEGFEVSGRPGASRMMLVFTDGRSKETAARKAMAEARKRGIAISAVLLGSDPDGAALMQEIATATGGNFVAVTDPSRLPDAFLNLRSMGVERVELRVNGSAPIVATLAGAVFSAEVPLEVGENLIVARATSINGKEREDTVAVTLRPPGCGELEVRAVRNGEPALSISSRAVEIVVDASGSMWGQMEGRTKIAIAKQTINAALEWLPADLNLSLRAYGHRSDPKESDCEDSELLAALATDNRAEIRSAVSALRPRGQTPLGYALGQVSADFGDFAGERAVVLVTDGIESCGGDAPAAARALQDGGNVPVHVIGFGLEGGADEEGASLRAIAEASGGRFFRAGSATELREALGNAVGTPYRVWRDEVPVAEGTLGADDRIRLPAGDYRVRIQSTPPHELSVTLASEENVVIVLQRDASEVVLVATRTPIGYVACEAPRDSAAAAPPALPAPVPAAAMLD